MYNPTVIVRHLEDENDLLNYGSDNLLKPGQEESIAEIANGITDNMIRLGLDEVDIVTSTKLRAYNTGTEVKDALLENTDNLPVNLYCDARMNELGQGTFILPQEYKPNDHFDPLMKAWDAYFNEVFNTQNLEYRFGDPCFIDGVAKYPAIEGAFCQLGENHREFSIRFYEFILDRLQIKDNGHLALPVVVTHQAIASRIHKLKHLAELGKEYISENYIPGKLVFLEWGSREHIRPITNSFKRHGGYYLSDLSILYGFQDIIYSELENLKHGQI